MQSRTDGTIRSSCFQSMVEHDSRYCSVLGCLLPGEELSKSMHRQDHIFQSKSVVCLHAESKPVLEERCTETCSLKSHFPSWGEAMVLDSQVPPIVHLLHLC